MKSFISDRTRIPLGIACIAIGGGAIAWTNLGRDVEAHSKQLNEQAQAIVQVQSDQKQYERDASELKSLVSRIDGKMDVLIRRRR